MRQRADPLGWQSVPSEPLDPRRRRLARLHHRLSRMRASISRSGVSGARRRPQALPRRRRRAQRPAEPQRRRELRPRRPRPLAGTSLVTWVTLTVALLGAVAIAVSLPQARSPRSGLRFTEGAPTSEISVAGSVAQQAIQDRATARASRSGSLPASPAPSRPAAGSPVDTAPCHITYSIVPDNGTRYTMVIVIANTSPVKVNGWTLRWDFPANLKIVYGWNAVVTNGPGGAMATDIGSDQIIPAGGSATIGFVGKRAAWVPTPTGFTLNGQACRWQSTVTVGVGGSAGGQDNATASPSVGATPAAGGRPATATADPSSAADPSATAPSTVATDGASISVGAGVTVGP